MDQKFWKWFVDKIVQSWSITTGTYQWRGATMISLMIIPKEGLYGKRFAILFDPTKPDSNVLIDFLGNTTSQTTKIGRRLIENFKNLTFKEFEPLISQEPFNLDFSDTKENLSTSNVSKIMKLLSKKFKDEEIDLWEIKKFIKDTLSFSEYEADKMATLFTNLKKQGIDVETASSNFGDYETTGTYVVKYVKPYIVYVKFEEEFDAQNEKQARDAFINAIENKELDESDVTKRSMLSQNSVHSIINYAPYMSISNKRSIISIEKID